MLERFTIDMLADQVSTQLREGEPTPKLAHRFFRKGRRDGRRAYDYNSVAGLLLDAVGLAGSTLCEELQDKRRDVVGRIASLQATINMPMRAPETPSDGGMHAHDPRDTEPAADEDESAIALREALEARRRLRLEQAAVEQAQALAAESEAVRQAHGQLAQQEAMLESLTIEYRQRYDSIVHTGQLLWSRYCNGFEQGHARRGSRDTDVPPPMNSIEFPVPGALSTTGARSIRDDIDDSQVAMVHPVEPAKEA